MPPGDLTGSDLAGKQPGQSPNEARLAVHAQAYGDAVLVHPRGTLATRTYGLLRDFLIKCAIDQPQAVLVDLAELEVDSEAALVVFSSAHTRISTWPDVPILLIAADSGWHRRLQRRGLDRFVGCYPDADQALGALTEAPDRRIRRTDLPAEAARSARARELIDAAAEPWGFCDHLDDVRLVATELVENALEHAGSSISLRLELRRGILTVAVADDCSDRAVIRERRPSDCRTSGLRMVAAVARAWGCHPTRVGKVVWATLRVEPRLGQGLAEWR